MKKIIIVLILIITAIFLASCTSKNNDKVKISFPTAGTTGTIYPLGVGIANIWNANIDYIDVNVETSQGGVANLNYLRDGEAQVSFAVASTAYEAMNGINKFENNQYDGVRVIAGLYYNPNQVVVRNDSNIDRLYDIKGKKFSPGAAGSTTEVETNIHLTTAGLIYPDEVLVNYVSSSQSIDLIRNKQIDGAWFQAGLPTSSVFELISTTDSKIISIDDETISQLQDKYPWYSKYTIEPNTYGKNQPYEVKTTAIKMLLLVDEDVPDDVVYDLTKTFWENQDDLINVHPVASQISIDDALTDLADIPVHDGALRYYTEVLLVD